MGMGICFKEKNKNKMNVNEGAPLPVISSASPGERILPELNDISTKVNNKIKMKIKVDKKDVNKQTKNII